MYQEKILLSSKDILEKEFKFDAKGYRPQEVDKYLDIIIRDYDEYNKILKETEQEKKELIEDNIKLKQEVRRLRTQIEALKETAYVNGGSNPTTNADILRRISNLEKVIYGKE
ncbi:MAG TPA: cell division regulator GpsB [Bacilli bacterium]|mgnify:CR=1 FL=1|nr:cell division regulator GpsB [Bacilli bacterium]